MRSLTALYKVVDNGCPSCDISPVSHGNTTSLSLVENDSNQKRWTVFVNFTVVLFRDLPYPLSINHESIFSPLSWRMIGHSNREWDKRS